MNNWISYERYVGNKKNGWLGKNKKGGQLKIKIKKNTSIQSW